MGNESRKFEIVQTNKAGAPVGPYSQATKANGFVFVAGEKGLDPKTNQIVTGGVGAETRMTLENIKAILEAAGSSMESVVSAIVFMTDLSEFSTMNAVYGEYLQTASRTCVEVKSLPVSAQVEITVTAVAG